MVLNEGKPALVYPRGLQLRHSAKLIQNNYACRVTSVSAEALNNHLGAFGALRRKSSTSRRGPVLLLSISALFWRSPDYEAAFGNATPKNTAAPTNTSPGEYPLGRSGYLCDLNFVVLDQSAFRQREPPQSESGGSSAKKIKTPRFSRAKNPRLTVVNPAGVNLHASSQVKRGV